MAERVPEVYRRGPETIEISAEGVRKIHPAVDFTTDVGYVGIWINAICRVGNRREFKPVPFLISNEREKVIMFPEDLSQQNIVLTRRPVQVGVVSQWSQRGIEEFLDGWTPDPKEVYERVREQFIKHIDFEKDPRLYDFLALHTIGTYLYTLFDA